MIAALRYIWFFFLCFLFVNWYRASALMMELGQLLRDQTGVHDGLSTAPSSIPALQNAQATAGQTGLSGASTGMTGLTTGMTGGPTGTTTVPTAVSAFSPAAQVVPPTGRIPSPSLCQFSIKTNQTRSMHLWLDCFNLTAKVPKKKKKATQPWEHTFFFSCALVDTKQIPSVEESTCQQAKKKVWFCGVQCIPQPFIKTTEEVFPLLKHAGGFKLMHCCRSRQLIDIDMPPEGYSVNYLKERSSLNKAVAYIVPLQCDLALNGDNQKISYTS